jgi:hypothetical protein
VQHKYARAVGGQHVDRGSDDRSEHGRVLHRSRCYVAEIGLVSGSRGSRRARTANEMA